MLLVVGLPAFPPSALLEEELELDELVELVLLEKDESEELWAPQR